MARSAAGRAELAAEALEMFLRHRPAARSGTEAEAQTGGQGANAGTAEHPLAGRPKSQQLRNDNPRPSGPGSDAALLGGGRAPLRLPNTDWLLHRLEVAGPAATVAAFRRAASGAGTIPWRLDLDNLEEDWFHRLVDPADRTLSLAGARMLAGQIREAVERRQAIAVSRVGRSRACPFDLHALVPVPADILHLGPDHPDALAWLWRHWGTTEALRHVAPDTAGKPWAGHETEAGHAALRLVFWSADWTPWRAMARIRADWPSLRLELKPDYTTGA